MYIVDTKLQHLV